MSQPKLRNERERTVILLVVIVTFAALAWGSVRITDSLQTTTTHAPKTQ
jgi:hypothetical protein